MINVESGKNAHKPLKINGILRGGYAFRKIFYITIKMHYVGIRKAVLLLK